MQIAASVGEQRPAASATVLTNARPYNVLERTHTMMNAGSSRNPLTEWQETRRTITHITEAHQEAQIDALLPFRKSAAALDNSNPAALYTRGKTQSQNRAEQYTRRERRRFQHSRKSPTEVTEVAGPAQMKRPIVEKTSAHAGTPTRLQPWLPGGTIRWRRLMRTID